ncbi:MAG: nicotinate-nucleotide--dimethylbenzimidazole phosphoribosyltransferase [Ornithinibacter sp.]
MTAPLPDLEHRLRALVDGKTKPVGSLGRVEDLAVQIGLVQRSTTPVVERCRHTIFAADHGLTAEGVSAYPSEVTRLMLATFLAGGAAASVFARVVGARVRVVDAGVAGQPLEHPDLLSARVGPGTANSALGPAMTSGQCEEALARGRELGADGEDDVVSFGEMGIGNTSAASLLCALVLGMPVGGLVGRGTGVDDAGLARKVAVLEGVAARVAREVRGSVLGSAPATAAVPRLRATEALREVGGFEIAMMTGAILGAASAGRVVIIDGFVAGAAAVAALDLDPSVRPALVFGHRSAESGHQAVLKAIGAEPLLDLGMRLGEGTGALLALPLLRAAAAMLCEMASFESVGIEPA